MSSATVRLFRVSTPAEVDESFDVEQLASTAADALETYRRASWLQLSDQTRRDKLRRAIELLQRVDDLETM